MKNLNFSASAERSPQRFAFPKRRTSSTTSTPLSSTLTTERPSASTLPAGGQPLDGQELQALLARARLGESSTIASLATADSSELPDLADPAVVAISNLATRASVQPVSGSSTPPPSILRSSLSTVPTSLPSPTLAYRISTPIPPKSKLQKVVLRWAG